MSKDNRGEAAIVGFVFMAVMSVMLTTKGPFGSHDLVNQVYKTMTLNDGEGFHGVFGGKYDDVLGKNIFTGIFAGSMIAFIYNRFNGIEMPSVLGFFSGRRLVPVLSIIAALTAGLVYVIIFP